MELCPHSVHRNITLKGGVGGRGDGWQKRVQLCASVPTIFVQDCRSYLRPYAWYKFIWRRHQNTTRNYVQSQRCEKSQRYNNSFPCVMAKILKITNVRYILQIVNVVLIQLLSRKKMMKIRRWKKSLFYRQTDLSSRVGWSGLFFFIFNNRFYFWCQKLP